VADPRLSPEPPVFFYDLGSPWCWLAAEQVGGAPEWVPVHMPPPDVDRAAIEKAATKVVWPEPFPFDSRTAMLAATFAKQTGRAVAFSLAAFRQAFLAGRDLSVVDNVLIAAAACELHPRAVLKALESERVAEALDAAAERARDLGVTGLPAWVGPGEPPALSHAARVAGNWQVVPCAGGAPDRKRAGRGRSNFRRDG
jgi:2-hydroxychromene-2-carboxylate isomerase